MAVVLVAKKFDRTATAFELKFVCLFDKLSSNEIKIFAHQPWWWLWKSIHLVALVPFLSPSLFVFGVQNSEFLPVSTPRAYLILKL